jgi:hypothetical protein
MGISAGTTLVIYLGIWIIAGSMIIGGSVIAAAFILQKKN